MPLDGLGVTYFANNPGPVVLQGVIWGLNSMVANHLAELVPRPVQYPSGGDLRQNHLGMQPQEASS